MEKTKDGTALIFTKEIIVGKKKYKVRRMVSAIELEDTLLPIEQMMADEMDEALNRELL